MTQTDKTTPVTGSIPHSLHRIALMGYGVVGQGLFHIIQNDFKSKYHLKGISIRDKKKLRNIPQHYFNNTSTELIQNTDIECVIEATDDPEFALRIMLFTASHGINFISANKKMIAKNLSKIIQLKENEDVSILYEASTGGAIPIIRTLDSYFAEEPIIKLRGIINGSSNYILSKIFLEGKAFEQALDEAIMQGFAESDPRLDLNGSDVQSKLIILALHAFGVIAEENEVFYSGIEYLAQADIEYAKERNGSIKLLANGLINPEGIVSLYVIPTIILDNDPFLNINAEINAIEIEGKYSGNHLFSGKGAGSFPTASALVSDLQAASEGYKYRYSKYKNAISKRINDQTMISVYTRFRDQDQFDKQDFEFIHSIEYGNQGLMVEGDIKLCTLLSNPRFKQPGIYLMEIPHHWFITEPNEF